MKNILKTLILVIISLLFLTACPYLSTSTMVRTVGLGEEAPPLGHKTIALEATIDELKATDYIAKYMPDGDEGLTYYSTGKYNEKGPSNSCNLRFGIGNYTEFMLGCFAGYFNQDLNNTEAVAMNGEVITLSGSSATNIQGLQLGVKRLLTDYSEPHKISMFFEGQRFSTVSYNKTNDYDGTINQFRTAILFAYVSPKIPYIVPNLSLYYSMANTKRKNTFADIPLTRNIQSLGGELNLNLNYSVFYVNLYGGMEKEFSLNKSNNQITYLGSRAGLRFNYSRSKN
ncbi:hypothetical protein JEZ13_04535 [bacterium]|nr:hypothetical protein [bacterium]